MDAIEKIYRRARVRNVPWSRAAADQSISYSDSVEGRALRHLSASRVETPAAVPFWDAGPVRSYRLGQAGRVVWVEIFEPKAELCAGVDFHFGAPAFLRGAARRFLDWLDRRFWVIPGDAFDNALASRFGGGGEPLDKHFDGAVDMLRPHARRLLGVWSGNHDDWSTKTGALHPGKALAAALGVPFVAGPGMIMMIVGGRAWKIYVEHGRGGGTTDGYRAGKYPVDPLRYRGRCADVSIRAHLHDARSNHITSFAPSWKTGGLDVEVSVGLVAGATLGYDGYPAKKCLDPIAPATSCVKLTNRRGLRREDVYDYDLRRDDD